MTILIVGFLREGMTSNPNPLVPWREYLSCSWGTNESMELLLLTLCPDASWDGHQTCAQPANQNLLECR